MAHKRQPNDLARILDSLEYLPAIAYVDEVDAQGVTTVVFIGGRLREVTGLQADDFATNVRCWNDRVHPDDNEEYRRRWGRLWRDLTPLECTYRFQRVDGDWIWLEDRATAVRDETGQMVVVSGVVFDVTAARETARTLRHDLDESLHELHAERETMALAQRLAHIGSFEWSLRGDRFRASPELLRILGLEPDAQPTPDEARALVHPGDREALGRALSRVAARPSEQAPIALRIVRPDGEHRWVEARLAIEADSSGAPVAARGAIQDITARKTVELELAEREANYRSLLSSVDDIVLVCDEQGTILEVNEAVRHLTGFTPDEVRGRHIGDFCPAHLRDQATDAVRAVLEKGAANSALPLVAKDGTTIPIDSRGWRGSWNGRTCVFAICRDLSEEREAAERFDRVFHVNPALMALNDVRDATFIEVNDAWLDTLGYQRDEVIGTSVMDLDLFAEPEQQQRLQEALATDGHFAAAELQVRTKDGRILDGIFAGELIHSHGKTFFLTVMVDDTRRRQAERALLELNMSLEQRIEERTRQLETANRELREFVDSMAHDLRGPLRTIGSFGQILEAEHGGELSTAGRDAVHRIRRANRRMERVIDALLDLSGLTHQPFRASPVDLSKTAAAVAAELHDRFPDRVVEVTIADNLSAVCDPSLVRVLFTSLLENAWKFTARRDVAHIEVGGKEDDGRRIYYVHDDGIGFDQRYVGRLFNAFERLHDDDEIDGTGIGLATVRRIVEHHGGEVWAEGRPGEGATFFFTLGGPPRS